ncbi:MAG: DUF3035 domain-containing protein [Rhizobiales bacterium]|nr:DUF3035 domain-containing protein [Hyphomicrobiales bacterium]
MGSGTLANKVAIGVVCAAGLMLSGCGNSVSNALNDTFGFSKDVPDERVVRTHQTLAVPPDLQLRPPAPGETVTGTLNPAAQVAASQPAYATPPGGIGSQVVPPAGTQPVYNQQAAAYGQPAVAGQPPAYQPAPGAAPLPPAQPAGDIYAKHGISKTHPDGKEKSHEELMKELRNVRTQKKRAQNPNYGTIWNFPNLFSDD